MIMVSWSMDVHGITIWRCEIFNAYDAFIFSNHDLNDQEIPGKSEHASRYPLVNIHIANWKITIFLWVNPLFLWPFSIVFCMFTRGYTIIYPNKSHWSPLNHHWITIESPLNHIFLEDSLQFDDLPRFFRCPLGRPRGFPTMFGETIEVLTMSEGEVSHFFIAPDLAYGHLDRTSRDGR